MRGRGFSIALVSTIALACGGPADRAPKVEKAISPDATADQRRQKLSELYAAFGSEALPLPEIHGPDLQPREPGLDSFVEKANLVFRARNVGDRDAGSFVLRSVVEWEGANGVHQGPVVHEEGWGGIPAGQRLESRNFVATSDLLEIDLRGMTRPIVVTALVYVDHPSFAFPNGRVIELNDGITDNLESYRIEIF